MSRTTIDLETSGLHCGSCSMLVDMTLADVAGVEVSKTDHVNGSTVVTFDDSVTDVDEIIGAIRAAGYDAKVSA